MPTAIWSGTISFSLVSVPVQLYPVADDPGPKLHQHHAADGGRIRYKRYCEIDGQEIPQEQIARGFPAGGDTVIVTDRDLDSLPDVAKKTIAIEAFVPVDQIDPTSYRRAYYIAPEKAGLRPYILMRDALARAGRAAVTRFAMRERESLALVRADGNVLVLHALFWPDEVRSAPIAAPAPMHSAAEQKAMTELIGAMSSGWEPHRYRNEYRAALDALIDTRAASRAVTSVARPDAGQRMTDLLTALQQSVARAKATRGVEKAA